MESHPSLHLIIEQASNSLINRLNLILLNPNHNLATTNKKAKPRGPGIPPGLLFLTPHQKIRNTILWNLPTSCISLIQA